MMKEYLDVLDEQGNKTGKTMLRSDVHKIGAWHRAAHVHIINSNGEILIQKRSPFKDSHANKWDLAAGGHVQAGKTSLETAISELNEELGVLAEKENLKLFFSYCDKTISNNGTFFNNSFFDVFLLKKAIEIKNLVLQKSEICEVKYVKVKELKEMVTGNDFVPHPKEYSKLFEYIKENKLSKEKDE